MQSRVALVLCLLLTACSGGGGGGGAIPHSAPNPGSTATAAPQGNHLAAAPATVYTATGPQSISKRKAQSVNLGTGGIPTVVGATSPYFGQFFTEVYAWADNAQNTPIPEPSIQAVPANAVSGPVAVASTAQDNTNQFASVYNDYVLALNVIKTGTTNLLVSFPDGTNGAIPIYIYDRWALDCGGVVTPTTPTQWTYQSGLPTGEVVPSDMSIDCIGLTLTFTNGATQVAAAGADTYGNLMPTITTVKSGTTSAAPLTVPIASLQLGTVYVAKLSDGGYAKIMPIENGGTAASPDIVGLSLHDNPSGSGQFTF